MTTVVGGGTSTDDGVPATEASPGVGDLAFAPDGTLYVTHTSSVTGTSRVRRVTRNGTIVTVAGVLEGGFDQDGGLATQTRLGFASSLALEADGSVLIAAGNRIRRVTPDGIITTIAGSAQNGFTGDGGPARLALLNGPKGLAVAPDGAIYFADQFNNRIRRIGRDGVIQTVAGGGPFNEAAPCAAGRALDVSFFFPRDVALAPDGTLYIADQENSCIRRLTPDGRVLLVTGPAGRTDDGAPINETTAPFPWSVHVGADGALYCGEGYFGHRVRRVGQDGTVVTLAGVHDGAFLGGFGGDNGPATAARLAFPSAIVLAPNGAVYIAANGRVRVVGLPVPRGEGAIVASADGSEVYVFDAQGRHVRTHDALTNVPIRAVEYDDRGLVTTVRDRLGLPTTFQRAADGRLTAVVAPGGQTTTVEHDANGYLSAIVNPANERVDFTSSATGLLATRTDPNGNTSALAYDALGRLILDADAADGSSALARTDTETGFSVTLTTALQRETTYTVNRETSGGTTRVTLDPANLATRTAIGTGGAESVELPDGTVVTRTRGGDPRFGTQTDSRGTVTTTTPGGVARVVERGREVVLAPSTDPSAPLGLVSQTDTVRINGREYVTRYTASDRTIRSLTPEQRETVTTLDALGRVVKTKAPGRAEVSLVYNDRGRLESITEGTGPEARVTHMSYDANDRLERIVDAETRPVQFEYDGADRVRFQHLPGERTVELRYDANGNVTSITPPGRPAHGFAYTPVDLEGSYTPPALDTTSPATTYAYNLDRQPTLVTRPDGQTLQFGYDAGGRLSTLTGPTGVVRSAYSATTGQSSRPNTCTTPTATAWRRGRRAGRRRGRTTPRTGSSATVGRPTRTRPTGSCGPRPTPRV